MIHLIITLTRWDDDDLSRILLREYGSHYSGMSDMRRIICSAEYINHSESIIEWSKEARKNQSFLGIHYIFYLRAPVVFSS